MTRISKKRTPAAPEDGALDPDAVPAGAARRGTLKGHDTRALGPSDSSDSGADMAGPGTHGRALDDTTDRHGTGERASASSEPGMRPDSDRDTDGVVREEEAGLGGGLDQAEEARHGVTDEELAKRAQDAAARKPRKSSK